MEARNLAYSLSSGRLEELGGSELRRVKEELYPSDFEWSKKGRVCVRMPPERITFELYPDIAPLAVANFMALCAGNKVQHQYEQSMSSCRCQGVYVGGKYPSP